MRTGYTANEEHRYLFENDSKNPYLETRPFDWIRAYPTGGRSLLWGRQSYRFNEEDFMANGKEGVGVDWPVRYKEIAPWYDYAERFAGISGSKDGLSVLPDGQFLPAMELNCLEKHVKSEVMKKMGRTITIGRVAHLSKPQSWHTALGPVSYTHLDVYKRQV